MDAVLLLFLNDKLENTESIKTYSKSWTSMWLGPSLALTDSKFWWLCHRMNNAAGPAEACKVSLQQILLELL